MMHYRVRDLPWPRPWVGVVAGNACCIHNWIRCCTHCTGNRYNNDYWAIAVVVVAVVDNDVVAAVVDTCVVVVAVVVDAVDGDDGDNVVDAGKLHCCNQVPLE